jgi:NTE family protein
VLIAPARRRQRRPLVGLTFALVLGGCGSLAPPLNEPLTSAAGNAAYRIYDANRRGGAESVLVMVALSGGGKRSAAFGFGVLRGMHGIVVRPEGRASTLLDEVDLLSGVSGGAFPAAHFALYGEKSFRTFPEEFLYRDIEAYIWGTFLLPWNWAWLFNPLVGTNDRMAQVYDRLMLHGASYADLYRQGRPQLSINATDISFGTPFGFLPQQFDVICSDLSGLPIARAVAASNGFPVLFGPVTLRNYRGTDCPLPPPRAVAANADDPRAGAALAIRERYADGDRVKWIHLMDGGIADNLALRVMINDVLARPAEAPASADLLRVRRILVISVNAASAPNPNWPHQRVVSGLSQIVSAATGAQINAYNLETRIALASTLDALVAGLRRERCSDGRIVFGHRCDDVDGKVLSVDLADYPDPAMRARLVAIRTGLSLPREQVDALVAAGETMIRREAGPIAEFLRPVSGDDRLASRR